jgi:CubicO group peptidase (beta-lactamase class C family)
VTRRSFCRTGPVPPWLIHELPAVRRCSIMPSRRSFLRHAAGAVAARSAAAADDAPSRQELAGVEGVASAFMRAHLVPGLSVAVARDGELLYERGFGLADRDNNEKLTPAHLFRIASVSKPITSVTLFRLTQEKRLTLEATVFGRRGILRDDFGKALYKHWVEEIRIEHLLTHTCGGWQNDGTDPMFHKPGMSHKQLITWVIENVALIHPPGEHYAYSNFGFCILGRVIEKLTGVAYEQYVRDAILKRCGVTDMRIAGNTLAERALGEVVYYGADRQNPYGMDVRRMDSHGGWLATARDLALFASHVDGHSASRNILEPGSIREMTTASSANAGYAKGWAVNRVPNWWHTGSLPGTTSIMVRTASGFCWAALANTREAAGDTGGAMDSMMWDLVRQVKSWKA